MPTDADEQYEKKLRRNVDQLVAARVDVKEAEMTNDQCPMTTTGPQLEHWALEIGHWTFSKDIAHD